MKEVTEHLQPGTAALFALVKSGGADSIAAAFRQFEGRVIQTSLEPRVRGGASAGAAHDGLSAGPPGAAPGPR